MSFKAINNSIGPNGLVLILLVFGVYPKMIEQDAPFPSITKHAVAMQKAMNKIQRCTIFQRINNVFNTWNGPSTASVHDLSINSPILVY